MHKYSDLEDDIKNTCWFFESIEKLRTACDRKLTHIGKRRQCICGNFYYPQVAKHKCPKCGGKLKSVKKVMTCLAVLENGGVCGYTAGELGCRTCGEKDRWTAAPKDIPLIRENVKPRLEEVEDDTEQHLIALVKQHPVWDWARSVPGMGPTGVGRMLSATNIEKCVRLSKFFAHHGWGLRRDGTVQRKVAGEMIGYDLRAQSIAYELAVALEKQTGERVARMKCPTCGTALKSVKKVMTCKKCGFKTPGISVRYGPPGKYYQFYMDWKAENLAKGLGDGRATSRAFRDMLQLMLSHFYEVWRKGVGLDYLEPFAYTVLSPPHSLGTKITPESMKQKS